MTFWQWLLLIMIIVNVTVLLWCVLKYYDNDEPDT